MHKSKFTRISAVATAMAMALSLTACGEDTIYAATCNGEEIAAGMYIYYLMNGYYDAYYQLETDEDGNTPDLFTSYFDGVSAKEYMQNYATEELKKYCAIEQKAAEYGVELSASDIAAAENYIESLWTYYGSYYEEYGISESSYLALYENSLLSSELFSALYSEGGEYGVSDDELKTYLDENYAVINYIEVELKDGEGNLLKSAGKEERRALEQEYIDRYLAGENFDDLNTEYTQWYENLIAEAEAAAEEEEVEEVVETADDNVIVVEESDAEANDATEEETTVSEDSEESTTTAVAEEEATEETAEETTVEAEETTAETTETEATEETEAEEEYSIEISEVAVDDEGEEITVVSNETTISIEGTSPSAAVVEAVFNEMEKGEIRIVEGDEVDYIVVKLDILETDDYFEEQRDNLLDSYKWDEYEAMIEEWATLVDYVKNEKAYDRYDPEKMFD